MTEETRYIDKRDFYAVLDIKKRDDQIRDERLTRVEGQCDKLHEQLGGIPLLDQRMKDFIDRMDRYLMRHDKEHEELRGTDDMLKRNIFIAVGVIGAISFLAPFVWDLIFR